MTEKVIQWVIMRERRRRNFCLPNYTPAKWWECDVFEHTPSGYFREYEVKISRADFKADADKTREIMPRPWGTPAKLVNKHELLRAGDVSAPQRFWYVVPKGLIEVSEVPEWAGLIYITDAGAGTSYFRYGEVEAKPAPKIHGQKCDKARPKHALGVCYWRLHDRLAQEVVGA